MYTKEEKLKAINLFIQYNKKYAPVIRELGYPDRRSLRCWYNDYINNNCWYYVNRVDTKSGITFYAA